VHLRFCSSHPVLTLKKVARLPSKDRAEVMKVLKNSEVMKKLNQQIRKRQRLRKKISKSMEVATGGSSNESFSSVSVSNDWNNWVVLRGSEKVAAKDVEDIGKVIGVSFPGVTNNLFSVLSRSTHVSKGLVLTLAEDIGDPTRGSSFGGLVVG